MRKGREWQNKAHIRRFTFFDEYLVKIFQFLFGDGDGVYGKARGV